MELQLQNMYRFNRKRDNFIRQSCDWSKVLVFWLTWQQWNRHFSSPRPYFDFIRALLDAMRLQRAVACVDVIAFNVIWLLEHAVNDDKLRTLRNGKIARMCWHASIEAHFCQDIDLWWCPRACAWGMQRIFIYIFWLGFACITMLTIRQHSNGTVIKSQCVGFTLKTQLRKSLH